MEIRDINHNDLQDLFVWRNNYESRKMSFETKKITLEEHQKWFRESIKNPNIASRCPRLMPWGVLGHSAALRAAKHL